MEAGRAETVTDAGRTETVMRADRTESVTEAASSLAVTCFFSVWASASSSFFPFASSSTFTAPPSFLISSKLLPASLSIVDGVVTSWISSLLLSSSTLTALL